MCAERSSTRVDFGAVEDDVKRRRNFGSRSLEKLSVPSVNRLVVTPYLSYTQVQSTERSSMAKDLLSSDSSDIEEGGAQLESADLKVQPRLCTQVRVQQEARRETETYDPDIPQAGSKY